MLLLAVLLVSGCVPTNGLLEEETKKSSSNSGAKEVESTESSDLVAEESQLVVDTQVAQETQLVHATQLEIGQESKITEGHLSTAPENADTSFHLDSRGGVATFQGAVPQDELLEIHDELSKTFNEAAEEAQVEYISSLDSDLGSNYKSNLVS